MYQKMTREVMARRAPPLEADALAASDKEDGASYAQMAARRDVAPAVQPMALPLPLSASAGTSTRIVDGVSFRDGFGTHALKSGYSVRVKDLTGPEKEKRSMTALESATIQRHVSPLEADGLVVDDVNADSAVWLRAQMALKALAADALAASASRADAGARSRAQMAAACSARGVDLPAVRPMALPLQLPTSATTGTRIVDGRSCNGGLGTLALKSSHSVQVEALTGPEKEEKSMAALESATVQRHLRMSASLTTPSTGGYGTPIEAHAAELYPAYHKRIKSATLPPPAAKVAPRGAPLSTSALVTRPSTGGYTTRTGAHVAELYPAYQKHFMSASLPPPAAKVAPRGAPLSTSALVTRPSTGGYATRTGAHTAELYPAYQKRIKSVSLPPPAAKVAPRGAPVAELHSAFLQTLPPKRPAPPEEGGGAASTKRPRWARHREGGCQMAQSRELFKTHGDGQVCTRDSGSGANKVLGSVSARFPCGKSGDGTCKIEGFARRVQQKGRFIKLGRQQMCRHEGCLKYAQRAGLCISHGGPSKRCRVEGCSNAAQVRGVCRKHGPNLKICTRPGCTNQAIKHGVCMKHGAKVRVCSHEGCTTYAQRGGLCTKHGTKRRRCDWDGCNNQAVRGGVCIRHGAKRRPCVVEGCPNYAQSAGVCVRHGARKKCTVIRPVENEVAASLLKFSEQDATNSSV